MVSNDNISHLMFKLENINKQLGGKQKDGKKKDKDTDEFNKINQRVLEEIYEVSKSQEARNEKIEKFGPSHETVMLSAKIRDSLKKIADDILAMSEALRRQKKNVKKYSKEELDGKEKKYMNAVEQLKRLQNHEKGGGGKEEKVITITEMRSNLAQGGRGRSYVPEDRELTAEEQSAMDHIKQRDQQTDQKIALINDKLLELKGKAEEMTDALENQEVLMNQVNIEVDKGLDMLKKGNARLKKLVGKRPPGKFCLDVILCLILLGLISVIVTLATRS